MTFLRSLIGLAMVAASLSVMGCTEIRTCSTLACGGDGEVVGWCNPTTQGCCSPRDVQDGLCISTPGAADPDGTIMVPEGGPNDPDGGPTDPPDGGPSDPPGQNVDPVPPFPLDGICDVPPGPRPGSGRKAAAYTCQTDQRTMLDDLPSLCRQQCLAYCDRWEWYCDEPCPDGFCDTQEVLDVCDDQCGDDPEPVECMRGLCQEALDTTCEATTCLPPADGQPGPPADCTGVKCENSCMFRGDGDCDDGDTIYSDFGGCEHGTDCLDCGPRFDSACLDYGEECVVSSRCCGFDTGNAWCVNLGEQANGLTRCMPDCTDNPNRCPDDMACIRLELGEGMPTANACFPVCAIPEM